MRITSLVVVAALVCVPAAARSATPLQLETAVWQAFKDKHGDAFKIRFAPAYVGVYEDGAFNLAHELQSMKDSNLESFVISDFSSRNIDPDDVLLTYTVAVKGTHGKDDVSGKYRASSLWHRVAGKWLGVYHSEIRAK